MSEIIKITLIGLAVGMMGTGMGGLIAFVMKNPSRKFLSFVLGCSSGLMLSIVCFDLLPEAFELGRLSIGILGIGAGVLMIVGIDERLSAGGNYEGFLSKESFVKTGMLLGLGIALHNFPEGLAIGSGFMAAKRLGMGISIVIGLHNIPEGISMAAPLGAGGMGKWQAFFYTLLAGVPMGMGALMGVILGEISKGLIGFCLSFAGGTMLYITCGELIPKAHGFNESRISSYGVVCGFILGMAAAYRF
ncbi:ZIP family metal transporter [Thermotalea metallivorans]|uniref:Zinc transporter ZupT n=1 Tax=Thermotalea metallivorans TaxID=520762 RepID=A0A140L6R7_9FIRM|nr:ZIP family metal transporter [Thermotalea metallivorans]KXG76242.1 Zinc transporter ZupT [Thermotalea metallivorans]